MLRSDLVRAQFGEMLKSLTLPDNWREIRNAWDGFHAASSAFAALALTLLLIATLRDTSSCVPTKGEKSTPETLPKQQQ